MYPFLSPPRLLQLGCGLALLVGIGGCSSGSDNNDDDGDDIATETLTLTTSGLENLGPDFAYEGWLIVDGEPVSTGTFTVADDGMMSASTFTVAADHASAATMFVLSIEPVPDPDPAPAASKLLAGSFVGEDATLDASAVVADFTDAGGAFVQATPTSAATDDDDYGIWFVDPSNDSAPMDLPPLADGWIYEGWIVADADGDGMPEPISTGTFSDPDAADSNGAGPAGGSEPAPPFPGEDFVAAGMMLNLTGTTVVISVEPVPDNSSAPFAIKPLLRTNLSGADAGVQRLVPNLGSLPRGIASFAGNTTLPEVPVSSELVLHLHSHLLPDVGPDYVYEGWLRTGTGAESTGRFTVDADGHQSVSDFAIARSLADASDAFILTIEPAVGDDPAPSKVHLIGGDLSDDSASLSTEHATAIGVSFAAVSGSFVLATPTSASTEDNDYGIWFMDPAGPTAMDLPVLDKDNGWQYEGWVVVDIDGTPTPISTGTFEDPAAADSDGAGPAGGSDDPPPPFPGQDFVAAGMMQNLVGATVVISVEPYPDTGPEPFSIKPLLASMIADSSAGAQSLELNPNTEASGTATILRHGSDVPADTHDN